MDEHSEFPSALDLAGRAGAIVVGLTTLTIQIFPFALPLLILVIGPLAILGLAAALLALPIVVPLWLARRFLPALRRRREPQAATARHEAIIRTAATTGLPASRR